MKTKKFLPLYARDSKGKIIVWSVRVRQASELLPVQIIVVTGKLGGSLVTHVTDIKKGKNIGKANETTKWEQAVKDARSELKNTKKRGYKSLLSYGYTNEAANYYVKNDKEALIILNKLLPEFNTDDNNNVKPMKAQPYFNDKNKPKIKFPCFIQPKINGVRAILDWDDALNKAVFRSKSGLNYKTVSHITDKLTKDHFYTEYEGQKLKLIYDGELYIPDTILADINSAVKAVSLLSSTLQYHIFDLAVPNIKQVNRLHILCEMRDNIFNVEKIVFVETQTATSHSTVETFHRMYKDMGYEGTIARDVNAVYKFGQRPATMTKLKDRMSSEFIIVDVIDSSKNPGIGIFVCRNDRNNQLFKVNPEGSNDIKREYFYNKSNYIGKLLTVEFYERTDKPKELPFHAVGICVRESHDLG